MNEMIPILSWWLVANYTSVKSFAFRKMSAEVYNFSGPVHKGVPSPWMKWNPAFNNDSCPTILLWKVSLSEKWVLNYTTLGFLFIKGLHSHEWNDIFSLTITGRQVYEREKFHFLKI